MRGERSQLSAGRRQSRRLLPPAGASPARSGCRYGSRRSGLRRHLPAPAPVPPPRPERNSGPAAEEGGGSGGGAGRGGAHWPRLRDSTEMTLEEEAVPPPQLRGRRVKVPRRRRAEGACRVKGVGRALCACAAVRGALPAMRGGGACACGEWYRQDSRG